MTQILNTLPQLSFGEAISSGFKKYAKFSGRARRSEFWWWFLFSFLMSLLSLIPILGWIIAIGMILPNLAMSVRRLHDVGRTGWWLLAPYGFMLLGWMLVGGGAVAGFGGHSSGGGFTLVIGGIVLLCGLVSTITLLVWSLSDSKPETNPYGPSPKYVADDVAEIER